MKRIINGKKYDTNTASLIYRATANCPCSDFAYWEEELFLKKTGEFFIAGEGHGFTKWASHNGNSSGYGYGLEPISLDEAKEWVSRHCTVDLYEETFGTCKE